VIFVVFCENDSPALQNVPMTRIHLFNHAEDAWEANLANWLEQRSKESFSGRETWFVTNSYLQGNWIRRMALSHQKLRKWKHLYR